MRRFTPPLTSRRPARPALVVMLAAAAPLASPGLLAPPAVAQEQPPTIQPAGRQPPAGPQPVPAATAPAAPAPAATAPATPALPPPLPPEQVRAQMPKLFGDLASADPAARESARSALMGMSREDLPAFEKLVRDSVPLAPAQAAVLREIVTHVYLAAEEYPVNPVRSGFLGVRLAMVTVVSAPPAGDADAAAPPPQVVNPFEFRRPLTAGEVQTTGVLISERMPGFSGSRMLHDGDLVLGVVERPDVPTYDAESMVAAVGGFAAGETIHLRLIRQGRVIRVPITLVPRPQAAGTIEAMAQLLGQRKAQVDGYWEATFAPLLKEGVG